LHSLHPLRFAALAAALASHALVASAHTTVMSTATEGARADNALRIGHVCEDLPVIAQSAVFPTDSKLLITSDAVDADAGSSPPIALDFGAGAFDVLVFKTGAGSESYTLTYHCMTATGGSGDHTGSGIATRQNQ
jgi:hypothetical protein